MRFGLAVMNDFPPVSGKIDIASRLTQMREQVGAARSAGIESIWVLQHYLGQMPTLQPIPLLGALAPSAEGMWLGTNMFILPLRHPVAVAEEYATLDHLSGGRVIAGFGMGYRENEFAAFGIAMDERAQRYEESVQIIRALWSGEDVRFAGKYFGLDDERISLPPVQSGGPRIWVGAGAHRVGVRRAGRLGDGWIAPPHVSPERMRELMPPYLQARAERADPPRHGHEIIMRRELLLDPDPDEARRLGNQARGRLSAAYAAYNAPDATATYRHLQGADAATEVADESYLFTDPATAIAKLRALADQGVTYVILRAQWFDLPHEQVLRTLDLFRTEVAPHFAEPARAGD